MNIHQLSVRYQIDQDRILLSLNTTEGDEVQVWLTRRITLGLWPLLNRIAIDHFAIPADAKSDGFVDLAAMDQKTRAMLADMRRQEAVQTLDFETPYKGGSGSKLLGNTPMLLTEINLTPLNGNALHLRFHEKLEGGGSARMFEMQFPAEIMFSVVQLLGQSLHQAQWQIADGSPMLESEAEPDLLEAKRPVYLN